MKPYVTKQVSVLWIVYIVDVPETGHYLYAKPQVSLTAPNHDHFAQVSLTVLDNFLDAIAKAKN